MAKNINLKLQKHSKRTLFIGRRAHKYGTFIFGFIFLVGGIALFAYNKLLERNIADAVSGIKEQETIIQQFSDIEEKKSILTVRTEALQQLYENRFDYAKAIDDIEKLFGYSIRIDSIELTDQGEATVVATKTSDIIVLEDAFSIDIPTITLTLNVDTSEDLRSTVDNLMQYKGNGLDDIVLVSSNLTEEGNYEVNLLLTFAVEERAPKEDDAIIEEGALLGL